MQDLERCATCGGPLDRQGNYFRCKFCGNRWLIDVAEDIHAVDRANAWAAFREQNYERAISLFENILDKDPQNYEAYWGLALSDAGIIYVSDLNENKRVPTFRNISETSFIKSKSVQKAITLADEEIAETYKKQAEQIEKIRIEWLDKASKEPPYDVFISFKASDEGRETNDSRNAQDLYTALVDAGYKVFFSKVSLKSKASEQYEPYIYNAIRTAKVMIVYGEKAEYFNATWIKNEWSRFMARIEKGEKHKDSLMVVVNNVRPEDVPISLMRGRQCLNFNDITFIEDIKRSINRIIEESRKSEHLQKIEIKGGQRGKKATTLSENSVKTREIGAGGTVHTGVDEKQSLELIPTFLGLNQWDEARALVEDILAKNPYCAEAIWNKILLNHRASSGKAIVSLLNTLTDDEYKLIEKLLGCADRDFAREILNLLYGAGAKINAATYTRVLKIILPFNYPERGERIKDAIGISIASCNYKLFILLIDALDGDAVDDYINYNFSYIKATTEEYEKALCAENILKVDEANADALQLIFRYHYANVGAETVVADFENLLKFTDDVNREVKSTLEYVTSNIQKSTQCDFAKQLLRYYAGDLSDLKGKVNDLGYAMLAKGFFEEAQYFFRLIISFDTSNAGAYWGICLGKIHARNESQILKCDILLNKQPEYIKYLTFVDQARREECAKLAKKQENSKKTKKKKKRTTVVVIILVAAAIAGAVALGMVMQSNNYDKANALMAEGKYEEAMEIFFDLGAYKDSEELYGICYEEARTANIKQAQALLSSGKYAEAIEVLGKYPEMEEAQALVRVAEALININDKNIEESVKAIVAANALIDLKYNTLGGSISGSSENEFSYGGGASFDSLKTAEMEGYRFVGWKISGKSYYGENGRVEITLDAQYSDEYSISYDLSGGSSSNPATYHKDGSAVVLTAPTRAGYTFVGWTGTDLTELTMTVTIPAGSYGDRSYTANWQANSYKVTFNADGGTCSSDEMTVIFGSSVTLPSATKPGYAFDGWYVDNTKVVNGEWVIDRNVTLTAKWVFSNSTTYVVNHHLENADDDGFTIESTENLTGTTNSEVTPAVKSYNGYITPSAETFTVKADGSLVVDYYYYRVRFNVTLVTNGGDELDDVGAKYDAKIEPPTPVRAGFTFGGWFTDAGLTQAFSGFADGDVTLYAYWEGDLKPSELSFSGEYELTVTGYNGSGTKLHIPAYVGGKKVVAIEAMAFRNNTKITSVIIPETVSNIGYAALSGCSSITDLRIPFVGESLYPDRDDYIPLGHIFGDTDPTYDGRDTHNPNNGEALTSSSFGYTAQIQSSSYKYYAYAIPKSLKRVTVTNQTEIPVCAFYNCDLIEKITIPEEVTSIGAGAFYNCTKLASLNSDNAREFVLPEGINTLATGVFYNCSSMTALEFPAELKIIEDGAFYGCSRIAKVEGNDKQLVIPEGVESIGRGAFVNLTQITSIKIANSVASIGYAAFSGCTALVDLTVPFIGENESPYTAGATTLGHFFGDTNPLDDSADTQNENNGLLLTSGSSGYTSQSYYNSYKYYLFVIPKTLKTVTVTKQTAIPAYAFANCDLIEKITLSSGVVEIGEWAFSNCTKLSTLNSENAGEFVLPDGISILTSAVFSNCTSMTALNFPQALTTVEEGAFFGCTHLAKIDGNDKQLVVPAGVESIGRGAFMNLAQITSIKLPDSVTSIGYAAFGGCIGLVDLTVPFIGESESPYEAGATTLGHFFGDSDPTKDSKDTQHTSNGHLLTSGTNGLTTQGYYNSYTYFAFAIPKSLKTVAVTKQTSIPAYAFANCDLIEKITISAGVTEIGEGAFGNCAKLSTLNSDNAGEFILPEGITILSTGVFYGCASMTKVDFPSELTLIGDYAFFGCTKLAKTGETDKQLAIPSGVDSIGSMAFMNLTQITSVIIPDTVSSIGYAIINGCTAITDLTVPFIGDNENPYTAGATTLGYFFGDSNPTIESKDTYLANNGHLLTSGTNGLTTQGYYNNYYYYSFAIPKSLMTVTVTKQTSIPDYAFANCDLLTSVNIPDNTETIGEGAFMNCKKLSTVNSTTAGEFKLPDAISVLRKGVFYSCSAMSVVEFPDALVTIEDGAFYSCSKLKNTGSGDKHLEIPEGVESIGALAFANLTEVTEITVSSTVYYIGYAVFSGCTSLVDLTVPFVGDGEIPSSVKYSTLGHFFGDSNPMDDKFDVIMSNDSDLLTGNSSLNTSQGYKENDTNRVYTYRIPHSLKTVTVSVQVYIADSTYRNCALLTTVTYINNVESVGEKAFEKCTAEKNFTMAN